MVAVVVTTVAEFANMVAEFATMVTVVVTIVAEFATMVAVVGYVQEATPCDRGLLPARFKLP